MTGLAQSTGSTVGHSARVGANGAAMSAPERRPGLITLIAARHHMMAEEFEQVCREVAFPEDTTKAELLSGLTIAYQHNLSPITKEVFFKRTSEGQLQTLVSVDGWIKKLNEHPDYDGMDFEDHFDGADKAKMTSCTISIYMKSRAHPIRVTEYMAECYVDTSAWNRTPNRMIRHRTVTQGARYAVGFAGAMDLDEFNQWQARERGGDRPAVAPVAHAQASTRKRAAALDPFAVETEAGSVGPDPSRAIDPPSQEMGIDAPPKRKPKLDPDSFADDVAAAEVEVGAAPRPEPEPAAETAAPETAAPVEAAKPQTQAQALFMEFKAAWDKATEDERPQVWETFEDDILALPDAEQDPFHALIEEA